jgi:uncharacterized OsmC-like protein
MVRLEHWKVQSAAASENGGGSQVDEIRTAIFLAGDLSSEQRERLLDVARKCPVHRTLAAPVRICTLLETEPDAG